PFPSELRPFFSLQWSNANRSKYFQKSCPFPRSDFDCLGWGPFARPLSQSPIMEKAQNAARKPASVPARHHGRTTRAEVPVPRSQAEKPTWDCECRELCLEG